MARAQPKEAARARAFRNRIVDHGEEDPAEIQMHPSNWRRHPEHQARSLRDVMNEVGVVDEVIINRRTGRLLNGHLRVQLARDEGHGSIPVKYVDLSEEEERIILFSFDATSAMATVDEEALRALAAEIPAEDEWIRALLAEGARAYNIDLTEQATEEQLAAADEPAPDPPEKPTTRPGDLWLLGEHRLLCGDAENGDHVGRVLGGSVPTIMVTDPPYGVKYEPNWRNIAKRPDGKPYGAVALGTVQNDGMADWRQAWALFPGPVAYVWHAGLRASEVADSLRAPGLEIRGQIVWAKQHFVISRGHYHGQHEPCWYAVRKGQSANWQGDRKQTTVWPIANRSAFGGAHDDDDSSHGTQKPLDCMRRPILNHTSPGQAVYDPFVGSGTTIIAAEVEARACYALDLDPAYVDVAVLRWQRFTKQSARLDGDGRSFEEIAEARAEEPAAA